MQHEDRELSKKFGVPALPGWAVLPLRLFLGGSFIAAGLDKLGDPAFLDPTSRDYIGQQIARFAPGTPLEGFLLNFAVPNAGLFGVLVMGGELCIGVAVLLGLLTRFSAFMGLLLNLTFFLSATWDVRPFYFGADLPYTIGWLTLMLAGPGPFALDWLLKRWLAAQEEAHTGEPLPATGTALTRRAFVGMGAAGLAALALAATGIDWEILHARRAEAGKLVAAGPQPTPALPIAPPAPLAPLQPAPEATQPPIEQPPQEAAPTQVPTPEAPQANGRQLLAAPGTLPVGQALQFNLPTGEPAVLNHSDSGYSAFVAICTHQGCTVRPNGTGQLACPCHGARFDASSGDVLRGPARRPLSPVSIVVDPDGSVYLVS